MAKRAYKKLARRTDGTNGVIFIDADTGKQITDKTGYEIISAGNESDLNLKAKQVANEEKPKETSDAEKQTQKIIYGENNDSISGISGDPVERNHANNFGYKDKPSWLSVASLASGPIGLATKAANVYYNTNNMAATNAARQSLGLPTLSAWDTVKGVLNDTKGFVGDVTIGGKTYGVSLNDKTPDGRTAISPSEAQTRGARGGGLREATADEVKATQQEFAKEYSKGTFIEKTVDKITGRDRTASPVDKGPAQTTPVSNQPYSGPTIGQEKNTSINYNMGPSRPNPPDKKTQDVLTKAAEAVLGKGATVTITSGKENHGQQHGSNRHGTGFAADVQFSDKNGKQVTDEATMKEIAQAAAAFGATGIGFGNEYMGNKTMHVDTVARDSPGTLTNKQGSAWGSAGTQWASDLQDARDRAANGEAVALPGPAFAGNYTPTSRGQAIAEMTAERDKLATAKDQAMTPMDVASTAQGKSLESAFAPSTQVTQAPQGQVNPNAQIAMAPNQVVSLSDTDPNLPAGMRNNNPGNLKYNQSVPWNGLLGQSINTDQGDTQAVFESAEMGMRAAAKLGYNKYNSGMTTARDIVTGPKGWTPGNIQAAENIARSMGIGIDDDLGLSDPERMHSFMRGIVTQEHGPASKAYSDELIYKGMELAAGKPMAVEPGQPQDNQSPGGNDYGFAGGFAEGIGFSGGSVSGGGGFSSSNGVQSNGTLGGGWSGPGSVSSSSSAPSSGTRGGSGADQDGFGGGWSANSSGGVTSGTGWSTGMEATNLAQEQANFTAGQVNSGLMSGGPGANTTHTTPSKGEGVLGGSSGGLSLPGSGLATAPSTNTSSGGEGDKIICGYFYRKGKIPKHIYVGDLIYAKTRLDKDVQRGYLFWATPLVNYLEKKDSRLLDSLLYPFTKGWVYEMAYRVGKHDKSSLWGRLVVGVVSPICKVIGKSVK